ncbi:hypothetical protein LTR09_005341 [Extremus antarcticus]|uniref:Uncharacterized protein n=1 Tax=Extremus antarcticus TaxID=702011 RepID=A0AAJ0DN19_9PEZI|nr:hypothetical protein LTR09_005341 [Extremus antarcticus]
MNSSPLNRLPRELRDQIYKLTLCHSQGVIVRHLVVFPDLQVLGAERNLPLKPPRGHRYFPTIIPGPGRLSYFPSDRKVADTWAPFAVLGLCRQMRQEARGLFSQVNDAVVAIWDDQRANQQARDRRPAAHAAGLEPLTQLLAKWRAQGQRVDSIVLEIQEPCDFGTTLIDNLFAWLTKLVQQPEYAAIPFRLSIPRLPGARRFKAGIGFAWSAPWRVDVEMRHRTRDLQARLKDLRFQKQELMRRPGITAALFQQAEGHLEHWLAL